METFTLLFFVLLLVVAALLVTQTIRRDLKARECVKGDVRRESIRARPHTARRATSLPLPATSHTQIAATSPLETSER
ncbi:MAG TPA: hypothetical protein VGP08_00115 [Pyrinomonadaceae bacterium]|jgi:hypothetical protein|nr:hypothetical protein [Pyrinomonadaceae bacterium]